VGVCQVWVGVGSTKVRERHAVLDRAFVETELLDKDGSTVRSSDTVEGIKQDCRFRRGGVQPVFDELKVEDLFEESNVVRDGIDDGDFEGTVGELADFGNIELGSV